MTGPEHYLNAESDIDHAARASDKGREQDVAYWLGCAQVHAILALTAATANPFDHQNGWSEVTR
jgi:hypothetical protein